MGRRERAAKALLLTSAACWIMGSLPAAAQVVLDGTLGPLGPLPGPDVTIPATLGTQAGPNLFHSFQTFSIHQGESATFTGPAGLNNVISRVTGGEISTIDGVLRSRIPNADFWFLNPAGVMFGPNTELDVPASFHLSTADELRFADGERFRATTGGATVLTVAPPEAFGFLRANPAKIEVNESRLETKPGQVLSLVGGDISIKGGDRGEILAEGGQIHLSALAGPGEVAIPDGTPSGAAGGAITLEDQALVDVSGNGSGTVRIRGGQFVLDDSTVVARNTGGLDAAGGIDVQADKVDMRQRSLIAASAFGSGKGGSITLDVGRLELSGGSQLAAATFGPGDAGGLRVTAGEAVVTGRSEGDVPSGLFTDSRATGTNAGKGGDITLTLGRLELSNGSGVAAETLGPGDAGNLTVIADEVVATGVSEGGAPSGLFANSRGESVDAGKGGNITLDVGRLELSEDAQVAAATFGPGDAGGLTVIADEVVATGGSSMAANSEGESVDAGKGGNLALDVHRLELSEGSQVQAATRGPGDAGDITLDVGRLALSAGSYVQALTFGPGDAGGLTVIADEVIATGGSGLFANSWGESTDAGRGGDITLNVAGRLELSGGAWVSATTTGPGNGGSLTVTANEIVATGFGSGLFTDSLGESVDAGEGGDITLNVNRLELRDSAQVVARTFGPGNGGSLTVTANEIVATGFGSGLFADSWDESMDAGRGGDITLNVNRLELRDSAQVAAETFGPGDAGSLTVIADEVIATGGSGLFTSSDSESTNAGKGGNLALDVRRLELSDGAQVGAGTFGPGNGGSLMVTANEVVATGGAVNESGDFIASGLFVSSEGEGTNAGKGGNLALDVNRLELRDSAHVTAGTLGPGDAGSLTVTANEVVATGGSGLSANSRGESTDAGRGGDITLNVGRLELSDGGAGVAATFGPGDAGGLTVIANEVVATGSGSGLFASSRGESTDAGRGGDITLNVGRLELRDRAQVAATTFGPGDAGGLTVTANEIIVTGRSGLSANSDNESTDAGRGGDITLNVGRLELSDSGQVAAGTLGPGDAGSLTVIADEIVATGSGSGLFTSSDSESTNAGKGGNLALDVRRLELSDSGQVAAGTLGPGDAGNLTVIADEVVATGVSGGGAPSGLFANSESQEPDAGKSGILTITAPTITLSDGAAFATSREGGVVGDSPDPDAEGPLLRPGSIDVEADVLRMSDSAVITAGTARVDAGDVVIEVEELIDLEDSAITTSAADGAGAGGNIAIDPRFLVLDNSHIVANAREGAGGNIDIAADFIFRSPDSVIDASSAFGISGTVDIAATDIDVTSSVVALPTAFLNPAALRARCGGRPTGGTGTFTGIGRGGTGLTPDAPLPGVYSDLIEPTESAATRAAPPPAGSDTPMFAGSAWLTSCHTE